jgi:RNA polymerase sigma-70 factor (ECF subfamily)
VVAETRLTRPSHQPPADADAVLVARAKDDPEAFAPLYARYLEEIGRFCYFQLREREAARDAAQQVFTRALAGLAGYRERGQFRAWLYAIARNVLASDARRRRPLLRLDAVAETADPGVTPHEAVTAQDDRHAVLASVTRLPDDQRLAIELRLTGLTGVEIAAVMGRSPEAVRKLQMRALVRLRDDLGPRARDDSREDRHGAG